MKHGFIVLTLLIATHLLIACNPSPAFIKEHWRVAYENDKIRADAAYKAGDYATALDVYTLHARMGSKFSQYRLAYMHEHGLGVEKNLVDALAWAHLAAEEKARPLVDYRNGLAGKLSESQRRAAAERSAVLYDKHSTYTIMEKAYDKARNVVRSCTGSRVGNTCNKVRVFGARNSFPVSFVQGSDGTLVGQGPTQVGLTGYVFMAPYEHNLRVSREYLQNYGKVEFGEFRVVEDEVDELVGGGGQSTGDEQ